MSWISKEFTSGARRINEAGRIPPWRRISASSWGRLSGPVCCVLSFPPLPFRSIVRFGAFYAPAVKVCFSLITTKLRTGDAIVSNTSRFTDQQSRNVSLSNRKKKQEKAAGKKKKERNHIKLFDLTFSRAGWWIAFFPLHLSLLSSSAFSPKRFLIFLSDRLWRSDFLT